MVDNSTCCTAEGIPLVDFVIVVAVYPLLRASVDDKEEDAGMNITVSNTEAKLPPTANLAPK